MSNQLPTSEDHSTPKGPRGTKLWLILLVIVSMFGWGLYMILSDDGGFLKPAQVSQVQKSADVPTIASAPAPSPMTEPYSYPAPGMGNPQASQKSINPGSAHSMPMAVPSASSEYGARARDVPSRGSSGANDKASDRTFGRVDQYSYSQSYEGNPYRRQIETGTGNVQIISYTDLPGSSFAEVLQKPEFEIKLRTAKRLKLGGATIESGEYTLKPRRADNYWQLLFIGSNTTSPAAALPLTAGRAPAGAHAFYVFISQSEKKGAVIMLLGTDQLTGYFEIE